MNPGQKFLKYKLHHVLIWMLVGVIWYYLRFQDYRTGKQAMLVTAIKVADLAILIYIANYVLIPRLLYKKHYLLSKDIDPRKLWLLEEGHCFRSQIMNLCELQKAGREGNLFEYEAGSIETLRRMVELNDGITILPELATMDLRSSQLQPSHFHQLLHIDPVDLERSIES